jgi:hypothetical protein
MTPVLEKKFLVEYFFTIYAPFKIILSLSRHPMCTLVSDTLASSLVPTYRADVSLTPGSREAH